MKLESNKCFLSAGDVELSFYIPSLSFYVHLVHPKHILESSFDLVDLNHFKKCFYHWRSLQVQEKVPLDLKKSLISLQLSFYPFYNSTSPALSKHILDSSFDLVDLNHFNKESRRL